MLETDTAYEVIVERDEQETCRVAFHKAWPQAQVGALSLALCIELEDE